MLYAVQSIVVELAHDSIVFRRSQLSGKDYLWELKGVETSEVRLLWAGAMPARNSGRSGELIKKNLAPYSNGSKNHDLIEVPGYLVYVPSENFQLSWLCIICYERLCVEYF